MFFLYKIGRKNFNCLTKIPQQEFNLSLAKCPKRQICDMIAKCKDMRQKKIDYLFSVEHPLFKKMCTFTLFIGNTEKPLKTDIP